MAKRVYEIDGRDFSTLLEFYEVFWDTAGIPHGTYEEGWFPNLDNFESHVRGGGGIPSGGFVLRWKNSDVSRERLGYPETVRALERRLTYCHPLSREWVLGDLQRAKEGVGPTVFDWLVEIFRRHGPGGEEERNGVELVLE